MGISFFQETNISVGSPDWFNSRGKNTSFVGLYASTPCFSIIILAPTQFLALFTTTHNMV
jgi:hypothetical protein